MGFFAINKKLGVFIFSPKKHGEINVIGQRSFCCELQCVRLVFCGPMLNIYTALSVVFSPTNISDGSAKIK